MAIDWAVALVSAGVFAATLWLTGAVREWLGRRAILDRPGHRSSHHAPVPRGGGVAVVATLLAGWIILALIRPEPAGIGVVIAAAAVLALVSWRDDLRSLPAGARLAAHAVAAIIGVAWLPASAQVFQGLLPHLLDRAAAAVLWVWFVNLYNFMDGIDGIAGSETACLGLGIAVALGFAGASGDGTAGLALVAAAAALGFLRWNWHPAKVFLGDVGSVPLGYLLGWLLLDLAGSGWWAPALILPLYYLADATITLARRAGRGERIWQAHREHFYQRALAPDGDHAAVVRIILLGNAGLVALAAFAAAQPIPALIAAVLVTAGMLTALERRSRG
ncbi:MAG TPA: glycosyl transferase [Stellaceae bacterium]|nr:glycosyl transferase [Stellaceae bacterium]